MKGHFVCEQYPPACIPSTACCLLRPAAAQTDSLLPKLCILPAHHLSPSWLLLTKAPFILSQPLPREMHSVPLVPGCGPCYHADVTPPRKRSWTSNGEVMFLCVSSAWLGMSFLCGRICDMLFKAVEMTIVKAFVKWNAVAALTNPFLSLAVLSRAGFSSLALFWRMPLVCELRA